MSNKFIISYISKDEFDLSQIQSISGYEIKHMSELAEGQVPEFAIVSDSGKMDELRSEFETAGHVVKFIFVGRQYKLQEFFDLNGALILDPAIMKVSVAMKLIHRSMTFNPSIHLQEIFGKEFEKYYSYKISNIYRLGYFSDLLCKDAVEQKLNFVSIRTFFDHAMMLNSYLVDLGLATFPCEMEFAFKENQLVLMLHLATEGVKQNHLIESLADDNNKNPIASLLRTCFKQADYLDVINYPKAKRLSIIGLWVSEEMRTELITPSISIATIEEQLGAKKSGEVSDFTYDYDHQSDPKELEVLDQEPLPPLPGSHKKLLEISEDSVFAKEEGLLQEITSFVQQQVELKNIELDDPSQAINVSDLSVEEVKKILADHPDQELVQKIKKDDEQLLTSVVVAGKAAEELIQVVSGKKEKDDNDIKMRLSSAAEQISEQINVKGGLFKENLGDQVQFISSSKAREKKIQDFIVQPSLLLEDAEFEVNGKLLVLNEDDKQEISEKIKEKLENFSTSPEFLALEPDEQQDAIDEQVQLVIKSNMPKQAKTQHEKKIEISEDLKDIMGSIENEIVSNFKSKNGAILVEDQVEVITNAVLNNVMNAKAVVKGSKPVEEAVEEIIDQMSIPEDQKQAFVKKIKAKAKKVQPTQIIEEEIEELVDEEVEVEEIVPSGEKKIVKKVVKVPKKVIKKVFADPLEEIEEEIIYEDEITEVEEIVPGSTIKKKVTKVVKVPKKVIKKTQAEDIVETDEETIFEEDETTVITGDLKNSFKDKKLTLKQKAKSLADDEISVVSGNVEVEEDSVEVVSGRDTFNHDPAYKATKGKNKNVQKTQTEEDLEPEVISGDDDPNSDDGYKVKKVKGSVKKDDGYKVSLGEESATQDDGYKVKAGEATSQNQKSKDFRVADNSHLVSKIEELEKKLQTERQRIRELEKVKVVAKEKVAAVKESLKEITKDLKEPDLDFKPVESSEIEAVVKEIKDNSGLSSIQKEKMFEVIEKEKQMSLKLSEVSDAYRKTKIALDTTENKYAAEIDELERSNRHKELLVEQMKTKVGNLEKDHQVELRRITFDLKKQQQRVGLAEADKYKQKITSLEREKNAMKRMLDELKTNVKKEKVKVIDQEVKASPKVAEFEAQKKRAEVKLKMVESELTDLKKTMATKDFSAKEVGEQRFKLEAEANKWKKEALTKQSEVEKAQNEKKRVEEELLAFKKRYEELSKEIKENKKVAVNSEQSVENNKASIASVKLAEDKIQKLKEEMNQEKAQINKELAKEREQLEEMKKSYLIESNKAKALETKAKEMAATIEEQAVALKAQETAAQEATTKATSGAANVTAKDLSALATKNRILEETSKKVTKDFNDTKSKLDEAKKEIANLTKKTNETQFKLQEKEKLAEKLQNELKAIKDKEAEAKKKEAETKKAA